MDGFTEVPHETDTYAKICDVERGIKEKPGFPVSISFSNGSHYDSILKVSFL